MLLNGGAATTVATSRLRTHLLTAGSAEGIPVLFIHGNVSSSRFLEETLAALPPRYRGLAPELRGFGEAEARPVDATRGLRGFADDLHALVTALGISKVHPVGWLVRGRLRGNERPRRAVRDREEVFVSALLSTKVGDDNYPGDMTTSPNWPTVAPGTKGINNAISPKHCDLSGLARINPKPDVLWIRVRSYRKCGPCLRTIGHTAGDIAKRSSRSAGIHLMSRGPRPSDRPSSSPWTRTSDRMGRVSKGVYSGGEGVLPGAAAADLVRRSFPGPASWSSELRGHDHLEASTTAS